MHRARNPLTKSFAFERLEARTVLNGTVAISASTGLLLITGDRANNAISVHQVGTNKADGGAIIQVIGLGTKLVNAETGKTGNSFTFGASAGVTILGIDLGSGNDTLNLYNTTVSQGLSIQMDDPSDAGHDGNDVVTASNVHCGLFSLELGGGKNVAAITNVTATIAGFGMVSGNGSNTVVLNHVTAGGGSLLLVALGDPGPKGLNSVTVVNCAAASAFFSDNGSNGVLTGALNKFDQQTADTFEFRFGDLKNDKT
jgi:hypothetical protein